MKRFERFNEMIFESYCMKSVLNAIKKERNRKDARGEVEQSLSTDRKSTHTHTHTHTFV